MIVIDSSVLIDYARKEVKLLRLFRKLKLAVCGVARAELLAGSRSVVERAKYITILNNLAQVATPESLWGVVGDYAALLGSNGVTIPLSDVIIAAVAIATGLELWTRDKHFKLIQLFLTALKLFQEPP
jgi:predicted nucleic acid-binding protein